MRLRIAVTGLALIGSVLAVVPSAAQAAETCPPVAVDIPNPWVSPNGDGSGDLLRVDVTSTCAATYRWSLLDFMDHLQVPSRTLTTTPTAGSQTFYFDFAQTLGYVPDSGVWTIRIESTTMVDGNPVTATNSRFLFVDNLPDDPAPVGFHGAKLFPYRDGYHDSSAIWTEINLNPSSGRQRAEVLDSAGEVIARPHGNGYDGFTWRGKDSDGRIVSPGTYVLRLVYTDNAGNRHYTPRKVTVANKRLLTRTWSKTVTPRQTFVRDLSRSCARVRTPARPDWRGSMLYERCHTEPSAKSLHRLRLPKIAPIPGIRYPLRRATLEYLGGRFRSSEPDVWMDVYIHFPRVRDIYRGRTFGPRWGWHTVDGFTKANFDARNRVTWHVEATNTNFAIRDFRVQLKYYVLK